MPRSRLLILSEQDITSRHHYHSLPCVLLGCSFPSLPSRRNPADARPPCRHAQCLKVSTLMARRLHHQPFTVHHQRVPSAETPPRPTFVPLLPTTQLPLPGAAARSPTETETPCLSSVARLFLSLATEQCRPFYPWPATLHASPFVASSHCCAMAGRLVSPSWTLFAASVPKSSSLLRGWSPGFLVLGRLHSHPVCFGSRREVPQARRTVRDDVFLSLEACHRGARAHGGLTQTSLRA